MPDLRSIIQSLRSPLEGERERAIQDLVRSGDVRAEELLQKIASSDESVAVRYMAKKGLFFLRKRSGGEGLESGPANEGTSPGEGLPAEKLQALLASPDQEQKLRLLQGLSRRKLTSALPVLLEHDVASEPPEIRSNMVLVIGILGGEGELRYLRRFLDDPDPRVRANTVEAMEYLGSPKMYPLLVKAMSDPDNRIRANAIKALRSYGKVNCLTLLEKMIGSQKVWMRDSAVYALSLMGEADSLPLLRKALEDEEPSVRDKARSGLEELARRGVPGASSALEEYEEPSKDFGLESLFEVPPQQEDLFDLTKGDPLESEDPKVRIRGVDFLVETQDQSRFKALLRAARKEEDGFVRAKMVVGLGRIGDSSSVAPLLNFLQDEVDRVRANAIEALVAADRGQSQHYLLPMLEDPNNRVRANAVMALSDSDECDVHSTLAEMVRSDQPLMRKSAFYAITDLATQGAHALIRELVDDEDAELRAKVQEYVQMSKEEGQGWAVKLDRQREEIRGEPLAEGGFAEFLPSRDLDPPLPSPDASGSVPAFEIPPDLPEVPPGGTAEAPIDFPLPPPAGEVLPAPEDPSSGGEGQGESEPSSEPELLDLPAPPAPSGPATARSGGEVALEARSLLDRFRSADREEKRSMIQEAKRNVCVENYFFLREILEEEDFEIKVQAKMALRNFDPEDYQNVTGIQGDLSSLLKPPSIETVEYRGVKQSTELGKELNERIRIAEQRGYWEGPFPPELPLLNALREDTHQMLLELLGEEVIEDAVLCYATERLETFRQGKKTLDSNRYQNLVNLQHVIQRVPGDTFHGSFLHSQKRPAYLLALSTPSRLVLFLRGSVQSTRASFTSAQWGCIDRVEANRRDGSTTVSIEVMGVLLEAPGLQGDDAKRLFERAQERRGGGDEAGFTGSTTKEFRRIDLLRQGGVITEDEYLKRKALLEKAST